LSKYDIEPKLHRVGEDVFKGYSRAQLADAWSRYLGDTNLGGAAKGSVTTVTAQGRVPNL
jgi:hypothetical protein